MKNGSKTGAYVQTYAPFLLVIIIGFFYHIAMKPMGGDDVFFSNATADMTLWEYLVGRYVNWTSRVVSEGILVTVIQVPLVWRIIDFLMFASLPVLISKIFGGGSSPAGLQQEPCCCFRFTIWERQAGLRRQ